MSLDIWPPVSPGELSIKVAEAQKRELAWIVARTLQTCEDLKHGLEDCYALLAPVDPGSTLVMSTPRNERVKGTITRVGTRIVKGSLGLQFRTIAQQTLTLSQAFPIHIHALDTLHTHLTESIDLLGLLLSNSKSSDADTDASSSTANQAQALSSGLRLLADSISNSIVLLKGPPLNELDTNWTTQSCPSSHFSPPLTQNFSFYVTLQECSIVLVMRALEPVDAPVHFGTKLGLAIGTYRRLEHDEADIVFKYKPGGDDMSDTRRLAANHSIQPPITRTVSNSQLEEVYVREKVRVESADPSLISLYSKLGYLNIMLDQARRNLDAVMSVQLKTYT
ncbi:rogdi leucine zipper containing protein domain-containing protein [Trichoderma breve]|uniref:Rogdi leucine zipper containing protein domain-containing protein n=1 Tax=Trichoderma breve TaxID=2034170 RepID=A0A9W9E3R4_9HYPO|nr:rogdi leucine zipper containing protein domain-containing protein [Trichoderma breve]KAJ4857014.1 rogdi leucine zipper containing protein domain-containing protein [Trichoderma breve]